MSERERSDGRALEGVRLGPLRDRLHGSMVRETPGPVREVMGITNGRAWVVWSTGREVLADGPEGGERHMDARLRRLGATLDNPNDEWADEAGEGA